MADTPHPSSVPGGPYDGVTFPYIPGDRLRIDGHLALHRDWTDKIDPITYEVVRHNLWNINEELGMTIQRISGSPVAMYAFDLNSSIFTEDGEFIYYGPYQLYMSGVSDVQVKWTLEHRSGNPGIFDGDMFLSNDPWVGAAHQMDVTLLCPVFREGKLFCWITNVLHQYDVGGITPGSFCPNARDTFDEGILIPPVKIIERGELRRDIEAVYLRASRKPYLVALDLRAQIAGNVTASRRIKALIERYGPDVVKGVMRKIIDTAEAAFLQKMAKLPDGTWRERTYVEVARVGDRGTYQVLLTMQKQGDRLVFDNAATAPQVGAINTTYSGWRGSILTAINELLCWDQLYAIGGALRHIEFRPAIGAFTSATHPASVSTAPVQAMEISLYPAYNTLSKMLACHPELKKDVMCIGGTSQFPLTCFRGIDQWGERFGYLLLDPMVGAIGAFSFRDGIGTGGQVRSPICRIGNVEHNEQSFPLLTLYRRENTDSGGAGKYRGGNSAITAFIPHGTAEIWHETESSGAAIPTAPGLFGGYPACTNAYEFRRDTDVLDWFRRRQIPGDIGELAGVEELLQLRQTDIRQGPADVYEVAFAAGASYGDPIERDPEKVRRDVESGDISPGAARDLYRVVLVGGPNDPRVDADATRVLRHQAIVERLGREPASPLETRPPLVHKVTEHLDLVRVEGRAHLACTRCGRVLCDARENYKAHALRIDRAIQVSNPLVGDPARFIDAAVQFRQFHCPHCGGLIENEVCRAADPLLWDIELAVGPAASPDQGAPVRAGAW
jgi:N-methylhydantoinase B